VLVGVLFGEGVEHRFREAFVELIALGSVAETTLRCFLSDFACAAYRCVAVVDYSYCVVVAQFGVMGRFD
jgi:hypothetical protein